ncbi:hypothetical protein HNO89_002824 [Sporosarcina luteola]|nr:hypothetical protein [Sporosarcina luteola]
MRLPMNITGLSDEEIENRMDGTLFQKLGYEIARKMKGEVVGYIQPSYPLNFYRFDIKIDEKRVSILLHEYFPYVAITSYKNELQIHFYDYEEVMAELKPYYTVLKAAFLNEPFNPKDHDLSEIEFKNVNYWRPKINGEVIFNCWD